MMTLRTLRFVLWLASVVLIVLAMGFFVLYVVAQQPQGRTWLSQKIETTLNNALGEQGKIEGLDLQSTLDLTIGSLHLSDAQGPWLQAQNILIDWRPMALWRGFIEIERLHATGIRVLRLPHSPTQQTDDSQTLPSLALPIVLRDIETPLDLDPALLGQEYKLGLKAGLALTSDHIFSDLKLKTITDDRAALRLYVDYGRDENLLGLDIEAHDDGRGPFAAFIAPTRPMPLSLSLKGQGSADDWQGHTAIRLDRQECLSGSVMIDANRNKLSTRLATPARCLDHFGLGEFAGGQALSLDAVIEQMSSLKLEILGYLGKAEIAGKIDARDTLLNIAFQTKNLERWSKIAGIDLKGQLDSTGTITGNLNAPQLDLQARLENATIASVAWKNFEGKFKIHQPVPDHWQIMGDGTAYPAATTPLPLEVKNFDWTLSARLDGQSGNGEIEKLILKTNLASLGLSGKFKKWGQSVDANINGQISQLSRLDPNIAGGLTLAAKVQGNLLTPQLRIGIDSTARNFSTTIEALSRLIGPSPMLSAQMRIDKNWQAIIDRGMLQMAAGTLKADGRITDTLAVTLAATLPDISVLAPDLALKGEARAQGKLSGSIKDPLFSFTAQAENLGQKSLPKSLTATLDARGEWRSDALWLDVKTTGEAEMKGKGRFNLTLSSQGTMVQGEAGISADAGRLAELFPELSGQQIRGRIRSDVKITGTMAAPQIESNIGLTDASIEDQTSGVLVKDLSATAQWQATEMALLFSGQGTDGGKGIAKINGALALKNTPHLDSHLVLERFRAPRLDKMSGIVDGDIALTGALDALKLSGSVNLAEGAIDIGLFTQASIPKMEVTEIHRKARGPAITGIALPSPRSTPAKPSTPIALDIDLRLNKLALRGQGLESLWKGQIKATGTTDNPALVGYIEILRGRYEVLGKTFAIVENSKILFDHSLEPRFEAVLESNARDIVARARLTGTISQLEIDISSTPSYPRDDIIARVFFGRSLGTLSTLQQVQLAQAAAGFLRPGQKQEGGLASFDIIGKLRSILDLDVLSVGSDETGPGGQAINGETSKAPTVTAGKYIGPDTYIGVQQSTNGSSVSVEQSLGGGFSVETEVGGSQGGGIGLRWRKDY